jgi:hypothetical protein
LIRQNGKGGVGNHECQHEIPVVGSRGLTREGRKVFKGEFGCVPELHLRRLALARDLLF